MEQELNIPREGALHSVITIGGHSFELRYGYSDERDRILGEPYILYPDLQTNRVYNAEGYRIVAALQSACCHYQPPPGGDREDCCYTCRHYPNHRSEIGVCRCEQQRKPPNRQEG